MLRPCGAAMIGPARALSSRKRESEAPLLSGLSKSSQYKYRALYKYK